MAMFNGKVVIVTGGSSGIGRATAVAFAREGARVIIADLQVEQGEETVRLVRQTGSEGFFVKADVSREADVKGLIKKTVEIFGQLDYAFNNAGIIQPREPLIDQSEQNFNRIINANVKGVWLCMKHEIPQMLKNGGGAIVNNSSAAGLVGAPGLSIYSASKHAVLGLTKSAALEYAAQGIRINGVCPGVTETPMINIIKGQSDNNSQVIEPNWEPRDYTGCPLGRTARPEEIAGAVLWLCSPAASYVIAHVLMVDGGYTAR
jgi:NAD(P)-dependent dehydrogenase (short-subunit alcohol dehydrogenase family)